MTSSDEDDDTTDTMMEDADKEKEAKDTDIYEDVIKKLPKLPEQPTTIVLSDDDEEEEEKTKEDTSKKQVVEVPDKTDAEARPSTSGKSLLPVLFSISGLSV